MSEIRFKFQRQQRVEFQADPGGRFRASVVTERIPCEPHVLYRVRVTGQATDQWATEQQLRAPKG